jgi:anti-anti-sigma factor
VPAQRYPIQWRGPVAVVALPAEIDVANTADVRDSLFAAVAASPAALIADMSGTTFCDSAGVNVLIRLRQEAGMAEVPLRVVITARVVLRVLAITGADRLLDIAPTVPAALASLPAQPAGRVIPTAPGDQPVPD